MLKSQNSYFIETCQYMSLYYQQLLLLMLQQRVQQSGRCVESIGNPFVWEILRDMRKEKPMDFHHKICRPE